MPAAEQQADPGAQYFSETWVYPWHVRVHDAVPAAPAVHATGSLAETGCTSGAKFTRREPGITWEPTLFVVEWIRK